MLNGEVSYVRKLKEAILARRIEATFTKQQILELYLNQIFLGRNSYGVEAAAQSYFGKSVANLDLRETRISPSCPKRRRTIRRSPPRPSVGSARLRAEADGGEWLYQPDEAAAASAEPLVAVATADRRRASATISSRTCAAG